LPSRIRRGQQGINLIEKIVLEMGSSCHPPGPWTSELMEPLSYSTPQPNRVRENSGVQSKVVANPKMRTDEGFDYYCDERDLNYWLQGNMPVVMIVSQPERGEAFWLSIKDYFNQLSAEEQKSSIFRSVKTASMPMRSTRCCVWVRARAPVSI